MTMSKYFTISVDKDTADTITNEDLSQIVAESIVLPSEASRYIDIGVNKKACEDLSDWNVDDFEVIKD